MAPGEMMRLAIDLTQALEAGDTPDLDVLGLAVRRRLDGQHDRLLAGAAPAHFSPSARAAQIPVVHFDAAFEPPVVACESHHLGELRLDLLLRGPGRAEAAVELRRGDALFGRRDQIHGAEPDGERQLRRFSDGACYRRPLALSGVALE